MNEYKIKINGNDYAIAIKDTDDDKAVVSVNGAEYTVELEKKITTKKVQKIAQPTIAVTTAPVAAKPVARAAAGSGNVVTSPLPGSIFNVLVKEGDTVKAGQTLLILEAMKMENNIESDFDGVVTKCNVSKGDNVLEGDVLITIG